MSHASHSLRDGWDETAGQWVASTALSANKGAFIFSFFVLFIEFNTIFLCDDAWPEYVELG
jgi:hypothetical protein